MTIPTTPSSAGNQPQANAPAELWDEDGLVLSNGSATLFHDNTSARFDPTSDVIDRDILRSRAKILILTSTKQSFEIEAADYCQHPMPGEDVHYELKLKP